MNRPGNPSIGYVMAPRSLVPRRKKFQFLCRERPDNLLTRGLTAGTR